MPNRTIERGAPLAAQALDLTLRKLARRLIREKWDRPEDLRNFGCRLHSTYRVLSLIQGGKSDRSTRKPDKQQG